MCQENYNTNKKEFKQLTYKDRVKIETLYNEIKINSFKKEDILAFKFNKFFVAQY